MKVNFISQDGFINFKYTSDNDVLIVDIEGNVDSFDFSSMPDGVATDFETKLPHCPVIKAERVNGILTVHLIAWYWGAANYENRLEGEAEI